MVEDSDGLGQVLALDDWKFFTQNRHPLTTPYGDLPCGVRAHWQWILPHPHFKGTGAPWTSASLKAVVNAGKAVT